MITAAERGGNISVEKLERIVDALGMTELPLRRAVLIVDGGTSNVGHLKALAQRIAREAEELASSFDNRSPSKTPRAVPDATADILQHVRSLPPDQQEIFRDAFLQEIVLPDDETNAPPVLQRGSAEHEPASKERASRRTK